MRSGTSLKEAPATADAATTCPRAVVGVGAPVAMAESLGRQLGTGPFAAVLVFASPSVDRVAFAEALKSRFGRTVVLGCTTAGEIGPEGLGQETVTAVGLRSPGFRIASELVPDVHALGLAEMLAGTHLDRDQAGLLDSLTHSAEMLLSLLEDVLDVSRIEAGRIDLVPTVVELRTLLDHVRLLFDLTCMQKGLRLCVRIADDLPAAVRVDGVRLRQVLVNLVGNAVKFTDNGEVTVEVVRGTRPDEIVFGVRDTGIGIASEAVGHLFEPFAQADQSMARRYGGSGLGLAICRRLCGLLGGELSVESEPGRGATFRFAVVAEPAVVPPKEPPPEPLPRFCARVLVVDDNQVNLRVATSLLERLGCNATAVGSGEAAIEMAARETFDLVLMDIQMPGMDGLEATRRLRADGHLSGVPIVALTANAMRGDEESYLRAGMDGYLAKPVRIRELAGGLARYLPTTVLAPL